jgi:hypothetical protein
LPPYRDRISDFLGRTLAIMRLVVYLSPQLNSLPDFSAGNSIKPLKKGTMRKIVEYSVAVAFFFVFAIVAWAH